MKTSGISKYCEKAWTTIKLYSSAGHQTIKNSSEYYKAAVDLCVPYVKLAGDVYVIVKNVSIKVYNNALVYVEKKTPVVLDTVSCNENREHSTIVLLVYNPGTYTLAHITQAIG